MKLFTYAKVTNSAADAASLAASKSGAYFIAGGTNLVDLMRDEIIEPEHLVDVSDLPYHSVEVAKDGSVHIGGAARNSAVANHDLIRRNYPLLSRALLSGASPQIRNMATMAGNLLQRTRCSYFYDLDSACNKRVPGSGCDAIGGFNRMNAVLGGSRSCIAVNPSDMCVALAALDATIHVQSEKGERAIPIAEFHRLPGKTPHIETELQPHEVITHIALPSRLFNQNWCYLKVRDRASYAFALVSVAVALEMQGGKIATARLALGGVGTKPWRVPDAEKALIGKSADERTLASCAEIAMRGAQGYEHNEFKIKMAKRAIAKAIKFAAEAKA